MATTPRLTLTEIVLDTDDAQGLARFYQRLLGGTTASDEPGWVTLRPDGGDLTLAFAQEATYVAPIWPSDAARQQMMLHLDFQVEDLAAATAHAIAAAAQEAAYQPQPDVRVMIDPTGHPFCLWIPT